MKVTYYQTGKDPFYHIWHTHESAAELLLFYSDGGTIVFREKVFPIRRGDFYLIHAGIMHYTLPSDPNQYIRSKLMIPEAELVRFSALDQQLSRLFSYGQVLFSKLLPEQFEQTDRLFLETKNSFVFGMGAAAAEKANLLKLFAYFLSGMTKQPALSCEMISQAIIYLNTHIAEPISIDDICRQVNVSKYHLCRKFKETTGLTIMEYLLKTRLEAAKQLLLTSRCTISEISEQTGFSSVSYFSRVFREQNGLSPLQYRKQN